MFRAFFALVSFLCPEERDHYRFKAHLKHIMNQSRIALTSGALVKAEGIVTLDQNIFVADTKDGGLREWLLHIPAWEGQSKGQSKEIPEGVPYAATAATMSNKTSSDVLQCTCHCEGVSFAISRPKPESSALHANWSDSLVPYFDNASGNGGDAKWWICANGTKYLATVCACKSCRLGSGYDLQFWLFCPEVNIQKTNGDPIDFEMGTLQRYHSSPGVSREFCKVCGATVFWRSDERPGFVDVSFGLLNADSGARAEEWVEWCSKRVSFLEFAQNRALVESVSAGLKEWATREKKHIW
ncbi:hypothetical protein MMC13_005862 [Lambiella insularis]|nr:hypothetical protein [Lambiella insularis]